MQLSICFKDLNFRFIGCKDIVNPFVDKPLRTVWMAGLEIRTQSLNSFFHFQTSVNLSFTFKQRLYFDPTDFLNLLTDTYSRRSFFWGSSHVRLMTAFTAVCHTTLIFFIQGRFQQMQNKMTELSTVNLKILDISLEQWSLFFVEQQFSISFIFCFVLCCSFLIMKCIELYTSFQG